MEFDSIMNDGHLTSFRIPEETLAETPLSENESKGPFEHILLLMSKQKDTASVLLLNLLL